MSIYSCKECGAAANVVDGVVVRTCAHAGVVLANVSATLYGESHVKAETAWGILRKLFVALFNKRVTKKT